MKKTTKVTTTEKPKLPQVSTLRPGLLVSVKTSVIGNCKYDKRDLDSKPTKKGEDVTRWETKRTIADVEEYEAAARARGNARRVVSVVCSNSAFGLLCPEDRADELAEAIAEGHRIATEFNSTAKLTRFYFNVISGRIAPDDVEAVRAINSEVRDLLDDMAEGVKNLDVKSIRDAAGRAKSIGQMLNPDSQVRIQFAIDAARAQANKISKAGEQAAVEVDRRTIATLAEARTAFLDMDEAQNVAKPTAVGQSVDFAVDDEPAVKRPKQKQRQVELG